MLESILIVVTASQQEGCQSYQWIVQVRQEQCYPFEISIYFGTKDI